jgi:flavin reductase (DIM6/NTAB) family NADH-FMN oxidoreductase RutF
MDPTSRKRTLRLLSNGLYVMTSASGRRVGAATVTWLSQASFTPPLVMAAIRPASNVFTCLAESRVAAVHVLDATQRDIAQKFFSPTTVTGHAINGEPYRINGEPYRAGVTGAPVLQNACAYFECRVREMVALGDHTIVVMEVVDAQCPRECLPLTVSQSPWAYGG